MFKWTIALAALAAASSANAQVAINFNTHVGHLGTSQNYTQSGLTVTATGYSAPSTPGHPNTTDLFGKDNGGDENGVGLYGYTDSEINKGTDFIQLNVSTLLTEGATGASFFMNSSTNGEWWNVYGSNSAGSLGTYLLDGHDEGSTNLHSLNTWWGTGSGDYQYFNFVARGTCNSYGSSCVAGNVLLGGLSVAAVPEPATWAMMLLGFGAIGFTMRRRNAAKLQLA